MGNSFDENIKKALMEGTKNAPELKEQLWGNIQNSIGQEQEEGVSKLTKKQRTTKNTRPSIVRFAAIAAVFVLIFLTSTDYGQAAINKVKVLFDPQKQITEQIEGMEEEKEYVLQEGQMEYIIYIDEGMYKKETVEGKDRIVPKNKAENLPEMFMEISQVKNKTPQEVAKEIETTLKDKYQEYENSGKVDQPIEALQLSANTGTQFDDLLVKHYLVDDTKGGTFIIKQQYTREAAEGHGARFYHMLKEFKIVNLEE